MHNKRSPLIPSTPNVRENFSELAKCSKNNQGNTEIIEMLVSMKTEMEEREKMWEQQLRIGEEFLEADFKRREQRCEQLLKQREEEWKEGMEGKNRKERKSTHAKIGLKNAVLLQ